MKMLSFINLLLLAVIQIAVSAQLIFSPTSLSFDDSVYASASFKSVQVTLNSAPRGDVHVAASINSNNFVVTPCNLQFTSTNWNVPQTITVRSLPIMLNTATQQISAVLTFAIDMPAPADSPVTQPDGSFCDRKAQTLQISRIVNQGKTCSSTGDPHYVTFDNEVYTVSGGDFQGQYLVDSAETTIIDMQNRAISTNPNVNIKVAVRHYDSYVVVGVEDARRRNSGIAPIDDSKVKVIEGSTPSLISVVANRVGYDYTITLADKSVITINSGFWSYSGSWYINIYIKMPATYAGRVSGYCGDYNGLQNGVPAIATVPRVDAQDNYFACPLATASEPMKGCRSLTKSFPNTCSAAAAPVGLCDAFSAGITGPVEEAIVPADDIEDSPPSGGFSDVVASSTSSSSRSTTRRTYTRTSSSAKPTSTSASSVSQTSSSVASPTGAPNPDEESIDPNCYKVTAQPVVVPQLRVDENDVSTYCARVFQNEDCTDSAIAYMQSCGDAPLSDVVGHAQDIMNMARLGCVNHIQTLIKSTFVTERDYARTLANTYDINIAQVDCNAPITSSTSATVSSKTKTSASSGATGVSSGDTTSSTTDGELNSSDSGSSFVAVGAGSAAAIVVLGGAIGGLFLVMRRRKSKTDLSGDQLTTGSSAALYNNPVYGDQVRVHENALYQTGGSNNADIYGKRRSIVNNRV